MIEDPISDLSILKLPSNINNMNKTNFTLHLFIKRMILTKLRQNAIVCIFNILFPPLETMLWRRGKYPGNGLGVRENLKIHVMSPRDYSV